MDIKRTDLIEACKQAEFDCAGYPGGVEGLRKTMKDLWRNHTPNLQKAVRVGQNGYMHKWLVSGLLKIKKIGQQPSVRQTPPQEDREYE